MRLSVVLFLGIWVVLGIGFSGCKRKQGWEYIDTVAHPITPAVNKIKVAHAYYNKKVQQKTEIFYNANDLKKVWLGRKRPNKQYNAFVEEVKASSGYGMNPNDYDIYALEKEVEALYDNRKHTEADASILDIKLTAAFFLYTTHLIEGRIRYVGAKEFIWKRGMPLDNDIALLLKMESAADVRKEIQNLQPVDPQYALLQTALSQYKALAESDTFPKISNKLVIKPAASHEAIAVVRRKINLSEGKMKNNEDPSIVYDDDLVKRVQRFQTLHGLPPNGIISGQTVRYLNTSFKEKAEVIALNLERLRWRPHTTADDHEIMINIPEFMLRVFEKGKPRMQMRVVTGSEFNATPVFFDSLKYIVFSPTWNVPQSIFEEEFLPKLIMDPGHFDSERFKFYKNGTEIDPLFEVWDDDSLDVSAYKVVENPGPANSLGNVKFIMPNDFSIYLHDTPADRLFGQEQRALSHGCIRLEQPVEFAAFLLRDQKGWTKSRIQQAMQAGKPLKVDLEYSYPVHIVYRTVWVDEHNATNFREDIYGHDSRHLAQLNKQTLL